jgi:predicted RNase H-like HicB family nuclease
VNPRLREAATSQSRQNVRGNAPKARYIFEKENESTARKRIFRKILYLCDGIKIIDVKYTISIQKNLNGWLTGQCEQVPEAITEGRDMDHLMKNMYDAITEALEIRKEEFLASHNDIDCIHQILYLPNEEKRISETSEREWMHA